MLWVIYSGTPLKGILSDWELLTVEPFQMGRQVIVSYYL